MVFPALPDPVNAEPEPRASETAVLDRASPFALRNLVPRGLRPALLTREIEDVETLEAVHHLVYQAYLGRGYCPPQAIPRLALYPHLDGIAETAVMGVFSSKRLVGTVSVTRDGPNGLNVDGAFKKECDAIRREGRTLASTWRMATTREQGHGRDVAMALIRASNRHLLRTGIQTNLLVLHPRHSRIYQRLMNMRVIGQKSCLDDLTNAPAVLLRWDRERLPKAFRLAV